MDIKIIILVVAFLNFLLGYFVYRQDKRKLSNISFSLFAWIVAFWCFGLYFYEHPIIFSSFIWIKIVYFTVILLIGSLFHFSFVYPIKERRFLTLFLSIYFLSAIPFIYILFFTKLWVKDVVIQPWGVETLIGPAYAYFGLFCVIVCGWALSNLIHSYRIATGIDKLRLRYTFLGILLPVVFIILVDVIIPLMTGESRYFWLSPIFSVFMIGCLAYAIIRYRLMDIRLVLRTGTIYFLTILILVAIILSAIYFFSWFTEYTPNIKLAILGGLTMAVLLLVFNPLKNLLLKLANRYFFQELYASQEALKRLGKKATTIIELDELIKEVVDTIKKAFGLKNISLLLKEKEVFTVKENIGFKEEDVLALAKEKPLLVFLEERRKLLVSEEIEKEGKLGNLREKMEEMNIFLILPLFSKRELIGLVILGPKVAKEAYTKEDLELLETLGSQAAMAIENAKLYQEVKDLTKNLEQKVKEQTRNIEALSEMKSEFLKIVNHQLRTPTTIIMSLLSMIQEGSIKGEEKIKETLSKAYLSSQRLITILDDLLNAQELIGERPGLNLQPCRIEDIISKVLEHFEFSASQKNLTLTFKKSKKPLPQVLLDEERIERVFKKLVDNAILYTEEGGLTITANLIKENQKDFIQIKIQDTGMGITKDDKEKLFKIFSRGKEGLSVHTNGSGLGLYIAKEYVEVHRGKIEVQSEGQGQGSTFIITLPLVSEV